MPGTHARRHDAHGTTHRRENPFAGQGSVLLDIGGDVGALVVAMPAVDGRRRGRDPAGRRRTSTAHYPHVAVVDRPVGDELVPSLVFADLAEGSYELYEKGGGPVRLTVAVRGGSVTEAEWP